MRLLGWVRSGRVGSARLAMLDTICHSRPQAGMTAMDGGNATGLSGTILAY